MKRLILTIVVVGLVLNANAQKLLLAPSGSFDFSYRLLSNSGDDVFGVNDAIISGRNERERFAPRAGFGVDFGIELKDKFTILTGIHFSEKGYNSKQDSAVLEILPSIEYGVITTREFRRYIDVPIKLGYSLDLGENSKLYFELGYINNFYLQSLNIVELDYYNGTFYKNKSKNSVLDGFGGQASAAIFFRRAHLMSGLGDWFVGPEFKMGIIPVVDAPIHEYQFSFGIRAGAFFHLKK